MNGMHRTFVLPLLVAACATTSEAPDLSLRRRQVWDAETAFAATMARRDHEAFQSFLSKDAIFMTGSSPLRGKAAVAEGWARYFEGPDAPFRWEPDAVEVLGSGDLALSTGPVHAPQGEVIGRFNSIWRLEGDTWRVVFDKGED
jgi:ketosteroid isomerase-like protein